MQYERNTNPIAPARICSSSSQDSPLVLDVFPLPVKPKFSGKASVLCIMNLRSEIIMSFIMPGDRTTRKDDKGDQPTRGEMTWTNTEGTRSGRGQHKTG